MDKRDLKIFKTSIGYLVKVYGRADFRYGTEFRRFARNLSGDFGKVSIDLKECEAMDSTFMGTLAMLGLKGRKQDKPVEMLNTSEFCRGLLRGLGLIPLFDFESREATEVGDLVIITADGDVELATAEAVVEAHKTLVEADSANAPKFNAVIDYAEKDLEKLKNKNKEKL